MLRVSSFKKPASRSTESAVEKIWAATWKEMGLFSRHMSDAVAGLPDRYLTGGKWVEFKSLFRARGGFTFGEGLSPEQIRTCSDLSNAGDHVFYCAQLDGWSRGKCYIFVPWRYLAVRIGAPINDRFVVPATAQMRAGVSETYLRDAAPVLVDARGHERDDDER